MVSGIFSIFLFLSYLISPSNRLVFTLVVLFVSFWAFAWGLEAFPLKRVWTYIYVLPFHIILGVLLSLYGFPNLSLLIRITFSITIFWIFYITCLILNVFVVVSSREKSIPLYRVAITWAQILIVVISIPYYAGIFKLNIHPFLQVMFITLSSFVMMLFFLWADSLEEGSPDMNLALTTSFWVLLMSMSMLFLPFEAIFRGLFLSSVLLFGIGYSHNYMKHTLTNKIVFEHVVITLAFLLLGILFIP